MNKEQLIKELNQYTKEQLIKAIADTDEILANRITAKALQIKNMYLEEQIEAAQKKWEKASADYQAYLKQVNEEYKLVAIFGLPNEVRGKLLNLRIVEERAYSDLETLWQRQAKFYEKTR